MNTENAIANNNQAPAGLSSPWAICIENLMTVPQEPVDKPESDRPNFLIDKNKAEMQVRRHDILRFLHKNQDSTVPEISDGIYTTISTARRLVLQLEEEGLVTKTKDVRPFWVSLTQKGIKLVTENSIDDQGDTEDGMGEG